jgi:hypothetical protein
VTRDCRCLDADTHEPGDGRLAKHRSAFAVALAGFEPATSRSGGRCVQTPQTALYGSTAPFASGQRERICRGIGAVVERFGHRDASCVRCRRWLATVSDNKGTMSPAAPSLNKDRSSAPGCGPSGRGVRVPSLAPQETPANRGLPLSKRPGQSPSRGQIADRCARNYRRDERGIGGCSADERRPG